MMQPGNLPGFYLDPDVVQDAEPEALRTAVPVFMGYVQRLPSAAPGQPVAVERYADFVRHFCLDSQLDTGGDYGQQGFGPFLRSSVYLYFLNGGGPCYVLPLGLLTAELAPRLEDFQGHWPSLDRVEEVTLVVPTDAILLPQEDYHAFCREALAYCAGVGRFCLLDASHGGQGGAQAAMDALRAFSRGLDRRHLAWGAAYFPYLRLRPREVTTGQEGPAPLALPSAAAAAAIAVTDRDRGIWKAPANVAVDGIVGLSVPLRKEEMEEVYAPAEGGSVNLIRSLHGRGTFIWGARTLAGQDNDWRYLNVRRLVLFVEQQLQRRTQFAVFEPNNMRTWLILKGVCESFLGELWEAGGLQGERREEAYQVTVGLGTTMSQADVDAGRLVAHVRLAAKRPAEFISIQLFHQVQALGR